MAKFVRSKLFVIPALLVLAVGLYALAGFWLVPKLIRSQATQFVATELRDKSLALGEIRFNPFNFQLDVRDIAISDRGKRMVALQRLFADFEAKSLWKRAWTFARVDLDAPYADTLIRPDGSLNLAELAPESDTPDAPLPHVWIEDLAVRRGRVDFADQSRSLQPRKVLSPIEFSLKNFHTTSGGGGFRLAASSDEGERFNWSGRLSLKPLASDGRFGIAALKARSVHEFFSDELPLQLSQGAFDLSGSYRFAIVPQAGMRLEATLPRITATDLGLRASGIDRDWVTLPKASLDNTRLVLHEQRLTIDALHVTGLKAELRREADGSLNLDRLLAPPTTASTAPATATPATTGAGDDWQFALGKVELAQADVAFEDRAVTPAVKFQLAPLALSTGGLSLDFSKPVAFNLQTTVNGVAPLTVSGEVVPDTVAAKLQVDVAKLPLLQVKPYLPDYPALQLQSGAVAANGTLTLQPEPAPGPELRFAGTATVTGFDLTEAANRRPFLSWDRLVAEGVDYTMAPDTLSIDTVRTTKPFARVIVAPDRSVNLVTLFGDAAPTGTPAPPAMASAPEMPIKIGRLLLDNGVMSFADLSIEPNFQANIQALRGSITGVSTVGGKPTKIDLDGHVINRFSPVEINGETNVAAYDQHTDVRMKFSNIELPIFNPYSGRYAGYAIAKGKLTTELHYRIDDRKLAADHHVIIDQLEWGQAIDSKDKVSLPIRLATSLLKNRKGVIDLNLPVTGSLDDPTFRVWPVVWQIIKNLLVKIVAAPFDFIGSLFKGAENAQFVDFAPGSAELPEASKTALAALAQGLADRPALKLDIPAGPALAADAAALTQQRFVAALATVNDGAAPDYATLERKDKLNLLEDLYRKELGHKPRPPETAQVAAEAGEDSTRKERKAARQYGETAWLEEQLRPRYQVDDNELVKLGQARATAVQEALLAGDALDPARVFLAGNQQAEVKDDKVRVKLELE
ncbi:DUF748 domain-containing protein [Lysobacter cavernae]|uniref:DUF748 domain-containing protein n=1 Tax=Lysobacter cavernae TaxID=1685901 RepID=A0ABV7RP60_9GAMM